MEDKLSKEFLLSCINLEKWKSGQWSDVATISRAIRKFLKANNINCKVSSEIYSGGDSVTVKTFDEEQCISEKLNEIFSIFKAGYFDGMNDIYEYYQNGDEVPTTKYFFYRNEISEERFSKAVEFVKNAIFGCDEKTIYYYARRLLDGQYSNNDLQEKFNNWMVA